MKMFIVPKNTKVILSNDDGNNKIMRAGCDAKFFRENLIEDPVTRYNNKDNSNNINKNTKKIVIATFGKNYCKFSLNKGEHTKTNYKYLYVSSKDMQLL